MSTIIRILPMDKINEFHGRIWNSSIWFLFKEVPSRVVNNDVGI